MLRIIYKQNLKNKGHSKIEMLHKGACMKLDNKNNKSISTVRKFIADNYKQVEYLENMPVAFTVFKVEVDERGNPSDLIFVYANKALAQLENITREKLIGSSFYDIFKNGDRKWLNIYWETAYKGVTREIEAYSHEIEKFLSISCYQPAMGYCAQILKDISEEKRLEIEGEKKQRQLDVILNNSIDIIFDFDMETNTISSKHCGASEYNNFPDIPGAPDTLVDKGLLDSLDRDSVNDMIEKIRKGENKASCEARMRPEMDKEFQWYQITLSAYNEVYSNKRCVVGFMKNINAETLCKVQLQVQADSDRLTELYNSGAGKDRIQYLLKLRKNDISRNTMFIFDFDNFKKINDTYGHYGGDQALKRFAEVLKKVFRKSDVIFRLGGDEFAVFAENIGNEEFVKDVCRRMFQQLQEINDMEFKISVSVGAAITDNKNADYYDYYRTADKALYEVKKDHKNSYKIVYF